MRRGDFQSFETDPLIDDDEPKEEIKHWDVFKNEPRKAEVGSTAESKVIESSIKWLKFFTIVMTCFIVLSTSVISKATLLLMTSNVKQNVTRQYCYQAVNQQFIVTLPEQERATWIWLVVFVYFVPELGTFIRSVRILFFKSWDFPKLCDLFWLIITELLPAAGSAILAFIVFPELDVIKAAMLTNAVCFIPALVAFFSRMSGGLTTGMKMGLDIIALVAQGTAFVAWPLVEQKLILYAIPAAVLMISFGWWENFVSENSGISYISSLAKSKKEFLNKTYFMYAVIAPLKCMVFLGSMLLIITLREGDISFLFEHFFTIFSSHEFPTQQIEPTVFTEEFDFQDALINGNGPLVITDKWVPITILLLNISSTYICYAFGKFACKIMIQSFSFAFPINLSVPVLLTILIAICGKYNQDPCAYIEVVPAYLFYNVPPMTKLSHFLSQEYAWVWLLWLLSQAWITVHIWTDNDEKLASTEKLFMRPMFDAFLIDQSIAMNRRRKTQVRSTVKATDEDEEDSVIDPNKDNITRIYACGTMWHETKEEMVAFLKSVLRLDEDQCAHRIVRNYLQFNMPDYYELETHILFDDAYVRVSQDDNDPHVNTYVLDLIDAVSVAASEVHATNVRIKPPIISPTPYGGRLTWTLPGKTKMIAHLKDKAKIRAKKRWSQCMYMYYLLGYRIMDNDELPEERIKRISENTYILALDGDIDFKPQSVQLLVDYMKKNKALGAACGRIHPVGSGAMAWYQIFEYAVGHWLQKATEHVIGCVLCSPGCFSLFRACALMDDNIMAKYTTVSEEARHYVQYDQGEDRWLCTLLLQRGYRVEYSAASDSYTHCPEGFSEFYNQRRRWMPSTTANILDLLADYKHIIKINDNISKLYIFYQIVLMVGTAIGPGSIFLMLVGAFVAAFKLDQWQSFTWNIIPILLFVICCATCKSDTQLFLAGIISAVYGLVMMAVLIGIFTQIKDDGVLAPSSLFFLIMAGQFVITALMHPQEFYCLKYGVVYYVTVPSMYMLLVIYSIFNMNNVSWGTREVTVLAQPPKEGAAKVEEKPPPKKSNQFFSFFGGSEKLSGRFANLCNFVLCSYEKDPAEVEKLNNIQSSLKEIQHRLYQIQRNQYDPEPMEPRKTRLATIHIEGARASRLSRMSMRNSVAFPKKSVVENLEEDEYADDYDESSFEVESDDVPENSWFYDGDLINSQVEFLDSKEETFWKDLIEKYLTPIDETDKKGKVSKDLKDLRDRMVMTFFMINCLYVLVIFLLTLQKEILHVNWPIDPKVNFSYNSDANQILIQHTYLELEPIGFVFLVFFGLLMIIQFIAMFIHRFGTYCQIMANTVLDFSLFDSNNVNTITEEKMLKKDPIKTFKKLIKLQGINDEEEDDRDAPVYRRNTAHFLALKKKKKTRPVIEDLDKAFFARLEKIKNGELKEGDLNIPRRTLAAIHERRSTIMRRKSQMPVIRTPMVPPPELAFDPGNSMVFDNQGYEQEDFA